MTSWPEGVPVGTSSQKCLHFMAEFASQVLSYGNGRDVILRAAQADPDCVAANMLAAAYLSSRHSGSKSDVDGHLASADAHEAGGTEYERQLLKAVKAITRRRWNDAIQLHLELARRYPQDLLSVKRGQILCFALGRQLTMLELAELVGPSHGRSPYYHGMLAFALLEVDRLEEAEAEARLALSILPADAWAQHALCHVLQDRCRFEEALELMDASKDTWHQCCTFMYTHNYWHMALCHLDIGGATSLPTVLEIYDSHLWTENRLEKGCTQVQINAVGMLLRLDLRGFAEAVDTRIEDVATWIRKEEGWRSDWFLLLLSVWTFFRAKLTSDGTSLLASLTQMLEMEDSIRREELAPCSQMAEGLRCFALGKYPQCCMHMNECFAPADIKAVGASNEQLDVFEEVFCLSLLKTGTAKSTARAGEILRKRTHQRPGAPFTQQMMNLCRNLESEEESLQPAPCTNHQVHVF